MRVDQKRKKLKQDVDKIQEAISCYMDGELTWLVDRVDDPLRLYDSCCNLLLWGHFLTEEDKEYIQMVCSWLEDQFNY